MTARDEVRLKPGWLRRDVERARRRMDELTSSDQAVENALAALDDLAAAIDETLYAYSHGMMSKDMAKESILALLPPQPKLEWRDDGLYLGNLLVGEVDRNGYEYYGFIYHDLLAIYDTEQEARAAVEKAVKESLGWKD